MGVNVLLTIERNGKAVAIGRVKDRRTVLQVARRCLHEKQLETAEVCRADAELGVVARGELRHTEQVLGMLIPELRIA
jgi:hypothetical protein